MAATATPALFGRVQSLIRGPSWLLVAAAVSTTLGHGPSFMGPLLARAFESLPPSATPPTAMPSRAREDPDARRLVLRQVKEAIVKMMPLAGAARCIETSLALSDAAHAYFTHEHILEIAERANYRKTTSFTGTDPGADLDARGERMLMRVYKPGQQGAAAKRLMTEVPELRYMSRIVTYGLYLGNCDDVLEESPLNFAETEAIVLACLRAQNAAREVGWHIVGCLEAGWTTDEVERLLEAIELLMEACPPHPERMPTVAEAMSAVKPKQAV